MTYDQFAYDQNACSIKIYKQQTPSTFSVHDELDRLHRGNITHVCNMPCDFVLAAHATKEYKILCIDSRLTKFVADECCKKKSKSAT